jgi:hypothetical protein
MQKTIITNIIAMLLTVAAMAQNSKVAVFDPAGRVDDEIKTIIREEIGSVVVTIAGYTVLEREMIDMVLKENRYQASGLVEDAQVIEMGKHLGADMVFVTSITRIDANYHISCKLIDVKTARIEKQKTSQTQRGKSDIIDVTKNIVAEIFGQKVKPAVKPAVSAGSELLADKRKVFSDGHKLSRKEVRQTMQYTDALRMYNKGISRNRSGNFWIFTGVASMAGGAYVFLNKPFDDRYEYTGPDGNPYYGYGDKKINEIAGYSIAGAGVVMAITGLGLKSSSKKYVRGAVDTYNASLRKRSSMEWQLNLTGNGMAFVINF